MKYFNIILVILVLFSGCKEVKTETPAPAEVAEEPAFLIAGAPISEGEIYLQSELDQVFSDLRPGDSLNTRFEAEVSEVCQSKGCWMRVNLPNDESVMVRFKDYGFFVPKDISGKKVIVEGRAFISEVPEEERRHMAEDAGAADSVIAQIRGSEFQNGFEATGVRIFK
ncbi:DUF4920 domain-containing protein [Robiginitalea sp.]|uniref:DUF4920 domain-containing protein n=2 Tax=Robiginitalea sp. TaxID=1902411 RepID=UPI003C7933FC